MEQPIDPATTITARCTIGSRRIIRARRHYDREPMARIRRSHALDDQRRGSFDIIIIIDCICGSWATSDPQHVQPWLQEQDTNITEYDDDIDGVEIFYGAKIRSARR